ncbi:probable ion channel POLLUX [Ananas comosus]|uniref:Probable ion channel POLLUX n=2 Tax=Ananas comosus TaxID=4615 RepID=A0A6P5FRV7_ANACO|nr:probable ion channel POLLUX [Ananas comosus]
MQQASDKSIIISEILDSRTRNLVSVSKISDYVLSNELVSMALAMVAEDKQINRVLEELFAEEGNEMCIRPAEYYLYEQEELSFYDIMVRARERGEIVIGYRLANTDQAIMNPASKSEVRKWSLDDVFVVISDGE